MTTRVAWVFLSCVVIIASGSCAESGSRETSPSGTVQLALTSSSASGATYRLRDGVFEITGKSAVWLSTEDHPADATLTQTLPAGAYSALLHAGWYMEKETDSQSR